MEYKYNDIRNKFSTDIDNVFDNYIIPYMEAYSESNQTEVIDTPVEEIQERLRTNFIFNGGPVKTINMELLSEKIAHYSLSTVTEYAQEKKLLELYLQKALLEDGLVKKYWRPFREKYGLDNQPKKPEIVKSPDSTANQIPTVDFDAESTNHLNDSLNAHTTILQKSLILAGNSNISKDEILEYIDIDSIIDNINPDYFNIPNKQLSTIDYAVQQEIADMSKSLGIEHYYQMSIGMRDKTFKEINNELNYNKRQVEDITKNSSDNTDISKSLTEKMMMERLLRNNSKIKDMDIESYCKRFNTNLDPVLNNLSNTILKDNPEIAANFCKTDIVDKFLQEVWISIEPSTLSKQQDKASYVKGIMAGAINSVKDVVKYFFLASCPINTVKEHLKNEIKTEETSEKEHLQKSSRPEFQKDSEKVANQKIVESDLSSDKQFGANKVLRIAELAARRISANYQTLLAVECGFSKLNIKPTSLKTYQQWQDLEERVSVKRGSKAIRLTNQEKGLNWAIFDVSQTNYKSVVKKPKLLYSNYAKIDTQTAKALLSNFEKSYTKIQHTTDPLMAFKEVVFGAIEHELAEVIHNSKSTASMTPNEVQGYEQQLAFTSGMGIWQTLSQDPEAIKNFANIVTLPDSVEMMNNYLKDVTDLSYNVSKKLGLKSILTYSGEKYYNSNAVTSNIDNSQVQVQQNNVKPKQAIKSVPLPKQTESNYINGRTPREDSDYLVRTQLAQETVNKIGNVLRKNAYNNNGVTP